jgi:hypothetical protein
MMYAWIIMASIGRVYREKWPVRVYTDKNAAKKALTHLRKLHPSQQKAAEGRIYDIHECDQPVRYHLARRELVSDVMEPPDEEIDSNAEDAADETYETPFEFEEYDRTMPPEYFNGISTVRSRCDKTFVQIM